MLKRQTIWLLIAGVVVSGVIVVVLTREREPEYGGKKLSEWVEVLDSSTGTNQQAAYALRQIGTNALPNLLAWLRDENPSWKSKFFAMINPILGRMNNNWRFDEHVSQARGMRAIQGFIALGPQAEGAIPELTKTLNDIKGGTNRLRAIAVLVAMGDAGVRPVLAAVSKRQLNPIYVVEILDALGTNARPAVGAFQNALKDPDSNVRSIATNWLRNLDPEALEKAGKVH